MDSSNHRQAKMTDTRVRFCSNCLYSNKCEQCDKTFKRRGSTSFHQIKEDFTSFFTEKSSEMIADIGCPNSVMSADDVNSFIRNLSHFQQENLESVSVDENFKFGPSGPYKCKEKLRIPIKTSSGNLWIEMSIVDAKIPMLLGNNVFKPLGAEIRIFSTGNGVIKLGETEIKMKETKGGHYTIKVKDLGKLCGAVPDRTNYCTENECDKCKSVLHAKDDLDEHMPGTHSPKFECDQCDNKFHDKQCLHDHKEYEGPLKQKSILKNPKVLKKTLQEKDSLNLIVTDLNTQLNGSKSKRERQLIMTVKDLVQLNEHKETCDQCEQTFCKSSDVRTHKDHLHGSQSEMDSVFIAHHDEEFEQNEEHEIEFNEILWNVLFSDDEETELTEEEKKEVLKLHRYFAHRSGQKHWQNLFHPAGRLKGKKRMVLKFLDQCKVCKRYKKTPPRPKVGLPKAKDVNDVVSMDLKIVKKSGKSEVAILYLHDEFSKLIKGQVINDKKAETIIKGIESKWIIGGGAGPGHPSRGFFSDNGGEFLNDDLAAFAAALNISIKMTAAQSPWMNGSCERSHATVDRMVAKLLEDDPKLGLQKAVDTACFVKNTEINKTGFSPLQLFCGRSPAFPGLSDCTPANIEMEGNNEYLRVLRRLDETRIEARKIDCNQRLKTALKSKINPSCEKSYSFGDPIWFKLDSSNKWKSGIVLGKDGKVLFIKYANFIRRVPLDRIIPADVLHEPEEEEPSPDDVENFDRLQDDEFENVEIVAQKDLEINQLVKTNEEQKELIKELENKIANKESTIDEVKEK